MQLAGAHLPPLYYPERGAERILEETSVQTRLLTRDGSDVSVVTPMCVCNCVAIHIWDLRRLTPHSELINTISTWSQLLLSPPPPPPSRTRSYPKSIYTFLISTCLLRPTKLHFMLPRLLGFTLGNRGGVAPKNKFSTTQGKCSEL